MQIETSSAKTKIMVRRRPGRKARERAALIAQRYEPLYEVKTVQNILPDKQKSPLKNSRLKQLEVSRRIPVKVTIDNMTNRVRVPTRPMLPSTPSVCYPRQIIDLKEKIQVSSDPTPTTSKPTVKASQKSSIKSNFTSTSPKIVLTEPKCLKFRNNNNTSLFTGPTVATVVKRLNKN